MRLKIGAYLGTSLKSNVVSTMLWCKAPSSEPYVWLSQYWSCSSNASISLRSCEQSPVGSAASRMAKPFAWRSCRTVSVMADANESSGAPRSALLAGACPEAGGSPAARRGGSGSGPDGRASRSSQISPSGRLRPPTQRTRRPSTWSQRSRAWGAPKRRSSPGARRAQGPEEPSPGPSVASAMIRGGVRKTSGASGSGRLCKATGPLTYTSPKVSQPGATGPEATRPSAASCASALPRHPSAAASSPCPMPYPPNRAGDALGQWQLATWGE
mmetsp:Transcript_28928/g.87214  ORF Transcript_28928/g.87214 Transcript_28928/m.87214 type:complete len:271 (-) Transcript_28928:15-827(-)